MTHKKSMVSLGFTEEKVPAGTHICQIYTEDDERNNALLQFLLSGLVNKERTACFSEKAKQGNLRQFFSDHGLSYDKLTSQKAFALSGTSEAYFENNTFDPDRMLEVLAGYHKEARQLGFTEARVIGEMVPEVQSIEGGDRLLEYEARVSLLLEDHPVTAVCQYDAHAFDGSTIMDVIKMHPMMLVRGEVVHNPFFIPPEEFLA